MVKIKFYFSNQFKTLECNPNTKMKFIFEKWAKEMGKEYIFYLGSQFEKNIK